MLRPILLLLAFHGYVQARARGSGGAGESVPVPHGSEPFVTWLKWAKAGRAPD